MPGSAQLRRKRPPHLAGGGPPVVVAARDAERAERLLPGCRAVADGPGRGPAAGLLGFAAAYPGLAGGRPRLRHAGGAAGPARAAGAPPAATWCCPAGAPPAGAAARASAGAPTGAAVRGLPAAGIRRPRPPGGGRPFRPARPRRRPRPADRPGRQRPARGLRLCPRRSSATSTGRKTSPLLPPCGACRPDGPPIQSHIDLHRTLRALQGLGSAPRAQDPRRPRREEPREEPHSPAHPGDRGWAPPSCS